MIDVNVFAAHIEICWNLRFITEHEMSTVTYLRHILGSTTKFVRLVLPLSN